MTITSNTLKRSSCSKCVEVLQELVAGLQQQHDDGDDNYYHRRHTTANYDRNGNSNNTRRNTGAEESSPLSLLKAIARSSHQQRTDYDRYGQQKLSRRSQHHPYHHEQQQHQKMPQQKNRSLLKIEDVEDGVRLTIPVETTAPTMMKQWTRLRQPYTIQGADDDGDTIIRARANSIVPALATSVRINDDNSVTSTTPTSTNSYNDDNADDDDSTTTQRTTQIKNPLTIELYCRKCSQKGPEAGARAFLMGPEPLSIVLCHNRIQSDRDEIEEILTHELIHLYDVQTLQLDLTDCETVAYSEIRAAREAECARYSPYRNAAKQGTDQHRATTTPTTRTWNTTNKEPDSENHPQNLPSSLSSSSLMQHVPNIISERWTKAQQSYCIQNIALVRTYYY